VGGGLAMVMMGTGERESHKRGASFRGL